MSSLCPSSGKPYDPEMMYDNKPRVICDFDGECIREFAMDASGVYPPHKRLVYDKATDSLIDAQD